MLFALDVTRASLRVSLALAGRHWWAGLALGLGLVAVLSRHYPESLLLRWAGWMMCAGIVLYRSAVYQGEASAAAINLTSRRPEQAGRSKEFLLRVK